MFILNPIPILNPIGRQRVELPPIRSHLVDPPPCWWVKICEMAANRTRFIWADLEDGPEGIFRNCELRPL